MKYNDNYYYHIKNTLNDVVGIVDAAGALLVSYTYDSWGDVISTDSVNSTGALVALANPIRYRSYYYDTETGLYYLNSRYYDPETGRFISPDQIIGNGNLYAYCNNDPVNYTDESGMSPDWWDDWGKDALGWVATAGLVVGAVVMIGFVAAGTVASGGLLAAVLVGAGVGILAGVGGSIAVQGGFNNADPWDVAAAGAIGGVVGAASGAASFGLAQIGQAAGQSIGFALSNARHISTGIRIAQVFGVTTSTLVKAGSIVGGVAGGAAGGMAANYLANIIVGENYPVNNPNYVRSGLLKFFQWLYTINN